MLKLLPLIWILSAQLAGEKGVRPVAIITAIEGNVEVYRYTTKKCTTATLEDGLFLNDSLITNENSEVSLLYNDGKIASFGSNTRIEVSTSIDTTQRGGENQEDVGGPPSVLSSLFAFSTTGERAGVKILVRGEEDSLALKVIEPGNTALITNKPDFIWNKFQNAQIYSILVQKMGNIIWQKTSADTFLKYPEDTPELAPGSYLLKIVAIKGNDTLSSAERFFKILKPEVISDVMTAIDNIKKQNPDTFTLHFLNAKIYEEKGLILDAIREYEELVKLKPDEPLLHQSLSLLYNKYGLTGLGNKHLDRFEELTGKEK